MLSGPIVLGAPGSFGIFLFKSSELHSTDRFITEVVSDVTTPNSEAEYVRVESEPAMKGDQGCHQPIKKLIIELMMIKLLTLLLITLELT